MAFNREMLEKVTGNIRDFARFMTDKGYDSHFDVKGHLGRLDESLKSHIAHSIDAASFETAFPVRMETYTNYRDDFNYIRADFRIDHSLEKGFNVLGIDVENRGIGIGIAKRSLSFESNREVPDRQELNESISTGLYVKKQPPTLVDSKTDADGEDGNKRLKQIEDFRSLLVGKGFNEHFNRSKDLAGRLEDLLDDYIVKHSFSEAMRLTTYIDWQSDKKEFSTAAFKVGYNSDKGFELHEVSLSRNEIGKGALISEYRYAPKDNSQLIDKRQALSILKTEPRQMNKGKSRKLGL